MYIKTEKKLSMAELSVICMLISSTENVKIQKRMYLDMFIKNVLFHLHFVSGWLNSRNSFQSRRGIHEGDTDVGFKLL